MLKKNSALMLVLILLLLASLACATITGGGNTNSLDATAQAIDDTVSATAAAAEATANAVLNGDDNGNGNDTGDDSANDASDDGGNDNGNTASDGDYEFASDGPENIPLVPVDGKADAEILFADAANLSYYTEAKFDDAVDFYRTAMIDLGWEAAPNGDVVFGELASLQYESGGDTAVIAIAPDPTSTGRLLVAITVQ